MSESLFFTTLEKLRRGVAYRSLTLTVMLLLLVSCRLTASPNGTDVIGTVNVAEFGIACLQSVGSTKSVYVPIVNDGKGGPSLQLAAGDALTVEWTQPRNVSRVVVRGTRPLSSEKVHIEYWWSVWPENGTGGWMKLDDPFNGKWITPAVQVSASNNILTWTVTPLEKTELPDIKQTGFPYRLTYKIRVTFSADSNVSEVEAYTSPTRNEDEKYTPTAWKTAELRLEWRPSSKVHTKWTGTIKAQNARILSISPKNNPGPLRIKVRYSDTNERLSSDRGYLIFRAPGWDSFSVFVDDVVRDGGVYVRNIDAFISDASKNLSYSTWKRPADAWDATIMEKVAKMPEQTFDGALRALAMKAYDQAHLGVPYLRQRFSLATNGSITLWHKSLRGPGPDCDRRPWTDDKLKYSWSCGENHSDDYKVERSLEDGFLPIIHSRWDKFGIHYDEATFATTLLGGIGDNEDSRRGSEPTVLLGKVEITNTAATEQTAYLWLELPLPSPIRVGENGLLLPGTAADGKEHQGFTAVRGRFDINGKGELICRQGYRDLPPGEVNNDRPWVLRYTVKLSPGEKHTVCVNIPYIELLDDKELTALSSIRFDNRYDEVATYWRDRLNRGMKYEVPDQTLNNLFKANLWHILIGATRDPITGLYQHGAATMDYANYLNETGMAARSLEMRGEHKDAFRLLEPFLVNQGVRPLPGNFKSKVGLFYSAYPEPDPEKDPYTAQGYNMHHGWALWLLSEHYKWNRDKEYLKSIAPKLIAGCDWVTRERQATKITRPDGTRPIEWGLAPAGDLEDIDEFLYYYATNAYYYLGMKTAAEVLAEIGDTNAVRLKRDAEAYRQDILASIKRSIAESPVVRLRNGTYIPYIPSRPYALTHLKEGWIRESLYPALHLLDADVVPSDSRLVTWMLQELEDNIFLSKESGYGMKDKDMNREFFDYGGFCIQPNLLSNATAHLRRDEIPNFLRVFFNTCAASLYQDIVCFAESVPSYGGGGGPTYKTPDESKFIWYMRQMLILEEGSTIKLGMGVPKAWMTDGKSVSVTGAATLFGSMDLKIDSHTASGYITASISSNFVKQPKSLVLRLRHPEGRQMKRVLVNGKEWKDFNTAKELVTLPADIREVNVTAYF